MAIEISKDTMRIIEEIAEMKDITTEEAKALVLNQHSNRYLLILKNARISAEKEIKLANIDK